MAEPGDPSQGLAIGSFVGEYRIEALLGEGGMGTVYAAVHPVIGKKVAVKVLAAAVTQDRNAIERFVLEARSVNAIGHANIVDIFSFGQLPDHRHYFVMERLEGETLRARIDRLGPVSAVAALAPFRDVGRALAAAHRNQIIHRDLKPDNIMLAADEKGGLSAKLLDFGVAKLLDTGAGSVRSPKTRAGTVVGTPQYMAPEQCLGGAVDARSDLYALGVVLFEALTGHLPFDGSTVVEIWQGHVGKLPPPLRGSMPPGSAWSDELEALVMQLLAKSPSNRLQNAAQLCEAIDAIAPTLGATPARRDRPPRLDAPLVPPTQAILMTCPGGVTAPSQDELARLAAAFEARIADVVTLDNVSVYLPPGEGAARDAGPPSATFGPVDVDLDMPDPSAAPHVPGLSAPPPPAAPGPNAPSRAVPAPVSEDARYAPPSAPEVSLELGLDTVAAPRPRRIPTAPPRPAARPAPAASAGSSTWLIVVGVLVVAAGVAALMLVYRQ